MAFPLGHYVELLESLRSQGFSFAPVLRYFEHVEPPVVFLRHDVDRLPGRAVSMAAAERDLDVASTYYFRCTPNGKFPRTHIDRVKEMGHEVGYHYETMARNNGEPAAAFESFKRELAALREIAEVKTVAAHGSPLSAHSNMSYTAELDMADLDLLGEPQVDFDYKRVLYITDTGGIFGSPHNRRDWADGKNLRTPTPPKALAQMIPPSEEPSVLINTHPERWPKGPLGLVQAVTMDLLVNAAKSLAARRSAA